MYHSVTFKIKNVENFLMYVIEMSLYIGVIWPLEPVSGCLYHSKCERKTPFQMSNIIFNLTRKKHFKKYLERYFTFAFTLVSTYRNRSFFIFPCPFFILFL